MQSKEEKNDRKRMWAKKFRARRKLNDLCTRCGKRPLFSAIRCYQCAVEHREGQRARDHSDRRVKLAASYHPEDMGLDPSLNKY